MFFRSTTYNRVDTLEAAPKANRNDLLAHSRVAPPLAETRQYEKSWASFTAAAEGFLRMGFYDKCIGVLRLAARTMPNWPVAWESLIRLQAERGLKADAVKTALAGARHFRSRRTRDKAIGLLKRGWDILPWQREVTFELARLKSRGWDKTEALTLLKGLEERSEGPDIRKVRGAVFWVSPSGGALWRWLKAALTGA